MGKKEKFATRWLVLKACYDGDNLRWTDFTAHPTFRKAELAMARDYEEVKRRNGLPDSCCTILPGIKRREPGFRMAFVQTEEGDFQVRWDIRTARFAV